MAAATVGGWAAHDCFFPTTPAERGRIVGWGFLSSPHGVSGVGVGILSARSARGGVEGGVAGGVLAARDGTSFGRTGDPL